MKKLALMMSLLTGMAVSGAAVAHAHLRSSVPANHSTVAVAPKRITLEFTESVQIMVFTIQKGDGPVTKLGATSDSASKTFSLSLPALEAGSYVVKWRAVSDDGHIMADQLSFSVGVGK